LISANEPVPCAGTLSRYSSRSNVSALASRISAGWGLCSPAARGANSWSVKVGEVLQRARLAGCVVEDWTTFVAVAYGRVWNFARLSGTYNIMPASAEFSAQSMAPAPRAGKFGLGVGTPRLSRKRCFLRGNQVDLGVPCVSSFVFTSILACEWAERGSPRRGRISWRPFLSAWRPLFYSNSDQRVQSPAVSHFTLLSSSSQPCPRPSSKFQQQR